MTILVLGNSNIFRRKVYFALKKIKVPIEVASRRNINKNFKIKKSYTSYKKALNDTKAKIVYISLINSEHFNWAVKALNKKKHVIIDKPITLNFNHTKKLVSLAKKNNLLLSEAIVFQKDLRFKNVTKKIDLKKTTHIYCKFHIPKLDKKNFRNFRKYGGGCFYDMSPYAAYLIYYFFNKKKYSIDYKKSKNGFLIKSQSKNIFLDASFSFNDKYKNEIIIYNESKKYFIDYSFSPPINKILNLEISGSIKQKKRKIVFSRQNVFYTYFSEIFKIISKKRYNSYYEKIEKIAEIKKKFS